jgi:2-oxoglutarate dehydrogenase E2 component (dihydrolipoamide succinyltransferase)
MPIEILVPQLGESVMEATVGRWLKQPGERVSVGEAVVEIETDKVNLEVGAEKDGILARIDRRQGDDVKVGDVLGMIDETGAGTAQARPGEPKAEPAPARPMPVEERATPVARRLAESNAVDLSSVTPTGPGGRVTKTDVQHFIEGRVGTPAAPGASPAPAATTRADGGSDLERTRREERVRMSRRRRTIARRLVEAQHSAAMLTTFNEVDMTAVQELRQRHKEAFMERHKIGLGLMSFFVKATVGALKAFPRLNAEIQEDDMLLKHYYDIGMAIGAAEGLVVWYIRRDRRCRIGRSRATQ